jgi:hypothetical protein
LFIHFQHQGEVVSPNVFLTREAGAGKASLTKEPESWSEPEGFSEVPLVYKHDFKYEMSFFYTESPNFIFRGGHYMTNATKYLFSVAVVL